MVYVSPRGAHEAQGGAGFAAALLLVVRSKSADQIEKRVRHLLFSSQVLLPLLLAVIIPPVVIANAIKETAINPSPPNASGNHATGRPKRPAGSRSNPRGLLRSSCILKSTGFRPSSRSRESEARQPC